MKVKIAALLLISFLLAGCNLTADDINQGLDFTTVYISPDGNDSNSCYSVSRSCRSIGAALDKIVLETEPVSITCERTDFNSATADGSSPGHGNLHFWIHNCIEWEVFEYESTGTLIIAPGDYNISNGIPGNQLVIDIPVQIIGSEDVKPVLEFNQAGSSLIITPPPSPFYSHGEVILSGIEFQDNRPNALSENVSLVQVRGARRGGWLSSAIGHEFVDCMQQHSKDFAQRILDDPSSLPPRVTTSTEGLELVISYPSCNSSAHIRKSPDVEAIAAFAMSVAGLGGNGTDFFGSGLGTPADQALIFGVENCIFNVNSDAIGLEISNTFGSFGGTLVENCAFFGNDMGRGLVVGDAYTHLENIEISGFETGAIILKNDVISLTTHHNNVGLEMKGGKCDLCSFYQNETGLLYTGDRLILERAHFFQNSGVNGSAIMVNNNRIAPQGRLIIRNSIIEDNQVTGRGSAIIFNEVRDAKIDIFTTLISDNSFIGEGAAIISWGDLKLEWVTIAHNEANGIWIQGEAEIWNSIIAENSLPACSGNPVLFIGPTLIGDDSCGIDPELFIQPEVPFMPDGQSPARLSPAFDEVEGCGSHRDVWNRPKIGEGCELGAVESFELGSLPPLDATQPQNFSEPVPVIPLILTSANCWDGPGDQYGPATNIEENTPIISPRVSSIPGWLVIERPDDPSLDCWVDTNEVDFDPPLDYDTLGVFDIPADLVAAKAIRNSSCRRGADAVFETLNFLYQNEIARLIGRSQGNDWYYLELPEQRGQCWIFGVNLELFGSEASLPFFTSPELPTEDDGGGNDSGGNDSGGGGTAPNAPSDVNHQCSGGNTIFKFTIFWKDNSDNEDGFRILRDGSQIGSVGPNVTIFVHDPGASGPYTITIEAFNNNGIGKAAESNVGCFG